MPHLEEEIFIGLGHYVYALVDPRVTPPDNPSRYFYVGKGRRDRCFRHAEAAIETVEPRDRPNPKLEMIRDIINKSGQPPPIVIIAHGLSSEEEALRFEACLIATLKTDDKGNLVRGHGGDLYALPLDEIKRRYSNPIDVRDLGYTVLLVNLNGRPGSLVAFTGIPEEHYPQRVLGDWPISDKRARRVDYVLGVYRQLVRVVFRIHKDDTRNSRFERVSTGLNKRGKTIIKRRFVGERCIEKERIWSNHGIIRRHEGQTEPEMLTKFPPQRGTIFLERQ